MNGESLNSNKKQNLSKKILICYKISNLPNNNLKLLLSNYTEVSSILKSNKKDLIYFLYFNRDNIHNILYDEEKLIQIKINKNNRNLSYYFYLSLLIKDKDIINYSYSIDYINDIIDNYQKKIEDKNKLKKLIISKLLLQIIDNYKNDENNNKDENYLKDIEDKNEKIINNNINYLKEINENINEKYIKKENIDIIYIDIIISLLKQNKLKDYEYVSNIFSQLDLERINIIEKMIDKLSSVLDIKNININDYIINNIDDLFNNNKINFYFILFKYLIKNNIYIYQFPLLIKIRKNILNIIKNLEKYSVPISNNDINNKINYILGRIIDSKYYLDYILQPILDYYKNYFFESKKNDIQIIEETINDYRNEFNYVKYLKDYSISIKMNQRFPIINYLFEINNKDKINKEEEINIYLKKWESIEEKINDQKYEEILDEDNQKINDYINIPENKDIFINIFNNDIYELYKNYNNINGNKKKEISIKTNSKIIDNNEKSFFSLIEQCQSSLKKITLLEQFNYNNENQEINNKNYKIIEYKKNIGSFNHTSEFIKELSDNNYISVGINNSKNLIKSEKDKNKADESKKKNSPFLFRYYENDDFEIKKEGPINSWVNSIEEANENNKNAIIFCFDDEMKRLKLPDGIIIKSDIDDNKEKRYNCLFKAEKEKANNFFLLCQKNYVSSMSYSISKISNNTISRIISGNYKKGIYIENNICALISSNFMNGEKDIITFLNYINGKLIKKFEGNYSFIKSTTGLCLMNIKGDRDKILLCACKKYIKTQKNGILLINNLKNINKNEFNEKENIIFYNTNNFEVHCFCPIFEIEKNMILLPNKNRNKITNYFFVGGFDRNRGKGCIKLYRIKIKKIIKIEEIVDINIKHTKEFKGFKGPISCIMQSTRNGKIVVTCWDGNDYLFEEPNLILLKI